jgi:DNA-directed RNA polymerase specialized sigma24 family protein
MPAERTIMRQVREVLRLKLVGGVPIREIARRIGVAASTVRATLHPYADAILDRIVHNAHRINLTGHSLRRSRSNKPPKD